MCFTGSMCSITQLISGNPDNVSFLLTLCDFAVDHKLQMLRDSVRNLLKLLPTGRSHDWSHDLVVGTLTGIYMAPPNFRYPALE